MRHFVVVVRGTVDHGVGGMERHTEDLCAAISNLGHQVSVVTTPTADLPHERHGVRYFSVPKATSNRYGPQWWRGVVPTLERVATDVGPIDGVISQSTAAQSAVDWMIDHAIPFVYILHGSARDIMRENVGVFSIRALARYLRAAYYWRWNVKMLPRVPFVFAIGRDLAERLQHDLGASGSSVRVAVLPNAVDTEAFSPGAMDDARRGLDLPLHVPLVGYSGRLTVAKGVQWMLTWFQGGAEPMPFELAVAGAGPLANHVRGARIHYVGNLDKRRLQAFYRAVDCLVLPTRHREGIPMAVLEAMASGVPVVAFDSGGVKEVVDASTGVLVEAGDGPALVQATRQLIADRPRRRTLGAEARRHMVERQSWRQVAEQVISVLSQSGQR